MSIIAILLPLALLLGLGFLAVFLWAVRHDQFADGDTPAVRMLLDETDLGEGDRPLASLALRPPQAPHAVSRQSPATASDPD
jgi:cbb3-type cytochrome oxidase maturation protein